MTGMKTATAPDDEQRGAYFPVQYLLDFLSFLAHQPEKYQFITYNDLLWANDYSYPYHYRSEYLRWRAAMAAGRIDKSKIYVLLQHDVDSRPERTMTLLGHQKALGIPSNIMIFNKRIDRKRLKKHGGIEETEYLVDRERLKRLEAELGSVIGYHCNTYERSGFDLSRARELFQEDVAELRRDFPIRYFSPHGGVPCPEGRNNRDVGIPEPLRDSLRWVHNAASPIFDSNYSDGGLNNPDRDPELRDLSAFMRSWKPGGRYRILIHPQYYHTEYGEAKILGRTAWYQRVLSHYERAPQSSLWEQMAEAADS